MKQTLSKELTNILFLVLIVAAAVIIYLLSRGESGASRSAMQGAAEGSAAQSAQENTPEPIKQQPGVPEAVFETYLTTSEVVSSEALDRTANTYVVTYDEASQVKGTLRYETREGCISSVEISFLLPTKFTSSVYPYPKALVYSANKALERALPEGLPALLSDVMPAASADGALQQSNVRYWAEQALLLKKDGAKFEDEKSGFRFLAYRSKESSAQMLVCVLFLDK